jgi:hypothetical protein
MSQFHTTKREKCTVVGYALSKLGIVRVIYLGFFREGGLEGSKVSMTHTAHALLSTKIKIKITKITLSVVCTA